MQGHIHKRVHRCTNGRTSTLWYVIVDLPRGVDGARRQKWHGGFKTRKAAEAIRARLVHELSTGFYVEPSAMLFQEWLVDHWLPVVETRVKKSTFYAYRGCVTHHIVPSLGGLQLGRLKSQQINGLYQRLLVEGHAKTGAGLSPASVLNVHVVIRKALADGVDAGLIAKNVAERAKPPRPQTRSEELRYWTPGELRHFLEMIEGHRLEAALHVLAMTGARRGEIAGLRWVDVDLDGARITIRQALLAVGKEVYISSPKSYRGRTVDLDRDTVAQLEAHRHRQRREKASWNGDYVDSEFVFRKRTGPG